MPCFKSAVSIYPSENFKFLKFKIVIWKILVSISIISISQEASQEQITRLNKFINDARRQLPFTHRLSVIASQRLEEVSKIEAEQKALIYQIFDKFSRILFDRYVTIVKQLDEMVGNKKQFYVEMKRLSSEIEEVLKQVILTGLNKYQLNHTIHHQELTFSNFLICQVLLHRAHGQPGRKSINYAEAFFICTQSTSRVDI